MTEAGLLASLEALAGNYRWVWHEATRRVFRAVDPALWDSTGDPFAVVRSASPERLSQLTADRLFRQQLQAAEDDLAGYLAGTPVRPTVAYFCMEHGIAAPLRTYAGGLGALAGCIEKTASDLGVPMVAVGPWYGWYFRQRLSYGWQSEEWTRAGPGRPGGPVPAGYRCTGEPAAPAGHHGPAVWRGCRAPAPPGDRARHWWGPGLAGAWPRARRFPCERGTRRVHGPGTHPHARWRWSPARPCCASRACGHGVHHAHRAAGGVRPLRPGAGGEVLLRLGARVRCRGGLADGPRSLPGSPAGRAVQHGRAVRAAVRAHQRGFAAAPRGHRATRAWVAVAGRGRAGAVRDQRRTPEDLDADGDGRTFRPVRRCGLGLRRRPT